MKYQVCTIRDAQLSTYSPPFYTKTKGEARRSFRDAVNNTDPNNMLKKHPEDFSLWAVGLWDDETGFFEKNEPELMEQAKTIVEEA